MDAHVKDVVRELSQASDKEAILFPQVVAALTAAGVERYHADLVQATRTFYMPDDSYEVAPCHKTGAPAQAFLAEAVQNAVRAIQRQEIQYLEFCERIAAAGCVGYFVTLAGRRAVYYGRTNDCYVEWFPGAKPGQAQ